ncbi:MAG: CopG family transcriptional regulator [Burkholderiaceae bacterium]
MRNRLPDAEKLTINIGHVDLGQIDLLVAEGFYSNRTDFIRSAIRQQTALHSDSLRQTVARKSLTLGLTHVGASELDAAQRAGRKLELRVLGLCHIAADVTPELARAAIGSITVLGALNASPAVKAALADRIR